MPVPFSINIGQRFTRLIVEGFFGSDRHRKHVWKCRCTCGTVTYVTACDLRAGKSRSCGCLSVKHGMKGTPEYRAWSAIKDRCYRKKNAEYRRYGGRGITMYEPWRNDFAVFYAYVGPRPSSKHSIERENNDGNYEPGNVKWATDHDQHRNMSTNTMITFGDETRCMVDWADHKGLGRTTLCNRLRAGWSVERALTSPAHPRKVNHT